MLKFYSRVTSERVRELVIFQVEIDLGYVEIPLDLRTLNARPKCRTIPIRS